MEPGHFQFMLRNLKMFSGLRNGNLKFSGLWNKKPDFFRDILELRNMVPEISGSEKFRFTVHLEISRNSGLMETLFRDEH